MVKLTPEEKKEFINKEKNAQLRKDMDYVRCHRVNPFLNSNGDVDLDRLVMFLDEFNEFVNHSRKVSYPFVEKNMKL